MTIKLLLVDDDQLVRTGLKMILESEPEFEIVGEASNGSEGVSLARSLSPDVILMDIQMPDMDGIEATQTISDSLRSDDESHRVLILTTFEQSEYVFQALRAGASGFLLKRTPADELISAVKVIARGESLLSPSVTRQLIERFTQSSAAVPTRVMTDKIESLTERELEVFQSISRGLSNTEIAEELFLSEGTVKTHVKHLLAKLDVRDRTQAVIFAYNTGFVDPGL